MDCTETSLGSNRATSLFETLMTLERAPTLRDLPLGRLQ